jgi:hypothetical protein
MSFVFNEISYGLRGKFLVSEYEIKFRKIIHIRGQCQTAEVKVVYPNWEIPYSEHVIYQKKEPHKVKSTGEKIITNERSAKKL